ncbi:inter-alpha-trypsin inhibitor heavy chain H3-like isoform X2 [Boleophthalmus pectinirostris]|uniref:inter-alpha-trypsin inhibitor heavy chain H3-like isoform X2 n=1 Tax=Boleophthalmus pectinirostris TaxID=150288 RepID=UPI002431FA31|nr:inter-alpha-trypsin inhibitor heavy chain H3-like isoform X2 [Boleophthalmus pectinirostris]
MWTVARLWLICFSVWLPVRLHGALIVSRRDVSSQKVEVYSVTVDCTVTSRFAHTIMTSKARNMANSSQEIFFEVELPKTAFITNFSMEIDGKLYVGEVKEKEKAKKQYDKAVSSGQTAGIVKAAGRKMELFAVSVNIAASSYVVFTLTYEELLQRKHGKYEILTQVKPKQVVQEFKIVANIFEPQGLAFVETEATFLSNDLLPLVEKVVTDKKARISFSPTVEQQRSCAECVESVINGDFIIKYDVKREKDLGDIQIVNGYFVHFFAPPDLPRIPVNVVFVIDRSGSMSGLKMEQTRQALSAILNDLHQEDHFALITFDHNINKWKKYLTKATQKNITNAQSFVSKIVDNGSTDIHRALQEAVGLLKDSREKNTVPEKSTDMIILLTDGNPNHGVSSIPVIQKNIKAAIAGNMSLFCLGFGNDVDYSFLDVMARENLGVARRIFEGSDAALQVQGFYEEISSPLLLDIGLRYSDNAVMTQNHFRHLFAGSEIVVAGKLPDDNINNLLVEVSAQGPSNDFQVKGQPNAEEWDVIYPDEEYIFGNFTERLWAYLTIQQLLEKSNIGDPLEKEENKAKALDMSLKYSFVTPLSSMVVTKPQTKDEPNTLVADKFTEDQRQQAERASGAAAAPSRSGHWSMAPTGKRAKGLSGRSRIGSLRADADGDPHFMIELPEREDALCFDINDKPGTIFNLVRDPTSGFVVNGEIIGKHVAGDEANMKTYFGRFGITHSSLGVRLEVSTQNITVTQDGEHILLFWSNATTVKGINLEIKLTKNCSLMVTIRHAVKFMVIKHTKIWKRRHNQQEYLGFYNLDSHHLSPSVHGLLGQFYHGVSFELAQPDRGEGTMFVKGQELSVTRHWQKDFSLDVISGKSIGCWFVGNNGTGLIDGAASDYIVPSLFENF